MLSGRGKELTDKMKPEEIFTRPCRICGEPITYTYMTKNTHYCSEACRREGARRKEREREDAIKAKEYQRRRAEQIAHQRDRSVWIPDYAERQKQKTLEMLGKIET